MRNREEKSGKMMKRGQMPHSAREREAMMAQAEKAKKRKKKAKR